MLLEVKMEDILVFSTIPYPDVPVQVSNRKFASFISLMMCA